MKKRVLGFVTTFCLGGMAHAAIPVAAEIEPNDTLLTAQPHVGGPVFTIHGDRTFENPSDDFFSFYASANALIEISVTLRSDDLIAGAESAIGLFGPGNTLLASGFGSASFAGDSLGAITFKPAIGGTYTIGFSGFNPGLIACGDATPLCYDTDDDFIPDTFVAGGGAGGSTGWQYALNVSAVPEPSSIAMLLAGLGCVTLVARRSRRTV